MGGGLGAIGAVARGVRRHRADTPTGGRVRRPRRRPAAAATDADGLADIDLAAPVGRHRASGALATMTVVRPELPFGIALLDADGLVTGFREKPGWEQWVNGGFLVLEPGALGVSR